MTRARDVADTQDNLGGAVPPVVAGKNGIINGGFEIWQRGTTVTNAGNGGYNADRWQGFRGTGAAGLTVSRQVTGDSTNLPFIQYCARVQRDSGNTSTQFVTITQPFETINTIPFASKTLTVSYYARAGANFSATSNVLTLNVFTGTGTDQTYIGGYTGYAQALSSSVALTTTWQRFSATFTLASTVTEMSVGLAYAPTGTAGANDYFEVTGVQVEAGSVATPFSRAGGTIQGELAACQRYYVRFNSAGNAYTSFGTLLAVNTTTTQGAIPLPVAMRVPPTSVESSTLATYDNAVAAVSALALVASSTTSPQINVNSTTYTQFRPYQLLSNNSTSAYLAFNAEL
jgi:hypothetical protein